MHRRMRGDQSHSLFEKSFAWYYAMPRRSAGRMRQWNQVEGASLSAQLECSSDHFVEFVEDYELRDRELADWNDEARPQDLELIVQPGCTISHFVRSRDSVAAGGVLSRETATNRREINPRADFRFVDPAELIEPAEERAAGCPRKRTRQDRFFHARRLTDENHFAQHGATGDRRRQHPRAAPTLAQRGDVVFQALALGRAFA